MSTDDRDHELARLDALTQLNAHVAAVLIDSTERHMYSVDENMVNVAKAQAQPALTDANTRRIVAIWRMLLATIAFTAIFVALFRGDRNFAWLAVVALALCVLPDAIEKMLDVLGKIGKR